MLWLILGGSGQLGKTLKAYLDKIGVSNLTPSSTALDIRSLPALSNYFTAKRPSVVVNCAAWTNVDEAERYEDLVFQVNGYAPGLIAQVAKKIGATLVHVSTDYVFSGEKNIPWNEDDPVSPISIYGESKALGESLVMQIYPENTYIIRTAWLYSKYGNNFVKTICRFAKEKRDSIPIVFDQVGQPTTAEDLANQIFLLVNSYAPPGIYHGTNSGQTSWFGLAKEIFKVLGMDDGHLREITSDEFNLRAPRPKYSVLSHNSWRQTEIPAMQDWKNALKSSIYDIYSDVNVRKL